MFVVTAAPGARLTEAALLSAARQSGFEPNRVVLPKNPSPPTPKPSPSPKNDEVVPQLAGARLAFREKRFEDALALAHKVAVALRPKLELTAPGNDRHEKQDVEIHQFISLANFALGNYQVAATEARAALLLGHHWNWKTLNAHYNKPADYSTHLRQLEDSISENATAEKRFLVAYHYWVIGQPDSAHTQFKKVAQVNPDDELVLQLLQKLAKDKTEKNSPSGQFH